jgi:hypothetical protein
MGTDLIKTLHVLFVEPILCSQRTKLSKQSLFCSLPEFNLLSQRSNDVELCCKSP